MSPTDLGEDEDWLRDVASEMEIEDGVIWVYGAGNSDVRAFTDLGIENLIELVRIYRRRIRLGSNAGNQNNPIKLRPTQRR